MPTARTLPLRLRTLAFLGFGLGACDGGSRAEHEAEIGILKGQIADLRKQLAVATEQGAAREGVAHAAPPTSPVQRPAAPPTAPAPATTVQVGPLKFGVPTVNEQMGLTTVLVEVTNTKKKPVSCTLSTTFKKGGAILTKADGALMDLPSGETRTVEMVTMASGAGYDELKFGADMCI